MQNLLQSYEIRLGDAMETLVEEYLRENGCVILDKRIDVGGNTKELDLHFRKDGCFFFAEQKMRDDHDSTKRTGQWADFKGKLHALVALHRPVSLRGFLFFVDPSFNKNKTFYERQINELPTNENVGVSLCYGGQFFGSVFPDTPIWDEVERHLRRWKGCLPPAPEIRFDEGCIEEIKTVSPSNYCKLFGNDQVWAEIIPAIFPDRRTLELLLSHFETTRRYAKPAGLLRSRLASFRNTNVLDS